MSNFISNIYRKLTGAEEEQQLQQAAAVKSGEAEPATIFETQSTQSTQSMQSTPAQPLCGGASIMPQQSVRDEGIGLHLEHEGNQQSVYKPTNHPPVAENEEDSKLFALGAQMAKSLKDKALSWFNSDDKSKSAQAENKTETSQAQQPKPTQSETKTETSQPKKSDNTSHTGRNGRKRPPRHGEKGYVKDGESADEKLARVYPKMYREADTPEKKAALLKKYYVDFYSTLKDENGQPLSTERLGKKQRDEFFRMLRNTPRDSDYAKLMGGLVHSLRPENRTDAFEEAVKTAKDDKQRCEITVSMLENIGESNDASGVQKKLITAATDCAKTYDGMPERVSDVLANQFVDGTVKSEEVNAQMVHSAITLDERAVSNIDRKIDQQGDSIPPQKRDSMRVTTGTQAIRVAGEQNKPQIIADGVKITTKIENAEMQAQATQTQFEIAKPEIKDVLAQSVGEQIGAYHKDAQLSVDALGREYDDSERQVYNTSAAQHLHEMHTDNQKEAVQRTKDSGNEEALNYIAQNLYNYDGSNVDFIEQALKESGYDSVMNTLNTIKEQSEQRIKQAEAEKARQEELKKINEQNQTAETEEAIDEDAIENLDNQTDLVIEKTVTKTAKTSEEKVNVIKSLEKEQKKVALKSLAESATIPDLKGLALSGLTNELVDYYLAHPSIKNNNKLEALKRYLSPVELLHVNKVQQERDKKQK